MDISVVVAAREDDRPPLEPLEVASVADRLGYRELWVGEGPTWDAFALAAAIGAATEHASLTAGPVPVSVRDPETIARGAAGVAALAGRPTGVALGTSSTRVVTGVHGRSRAGAASALAEAARALRALGVGTGSAWQTQLPPGFRRRLAPAGGPLTVAAFGDRAIAVAAEHADRMLLDLVTPEQVSELRARLGRAARDAGRTPPPLVAWLPAAVDPDPASLRQVLGSIAGYLTVRGYREMFVNAGFGAAVELAGAGAGPEVLVDALPEEAVQMVGLVGDARAVKGRLDAYADAGLDEIGVVPATAGDPGGERTLTGLLGLAGSIRGPERPA